MPFLELFVKNSHPARPGCVHPTCRILDSGKDDSCGYGRWKQHSQLCGTASRAQRSAEIFPVVLRLAVLGLTWSTR